MESQGIEADLMGKYDYLITERHVLCAACALSRNGLTSHSTQHLCLQTPYAEIDGTCVVYITYFYCKNIDYEYFVTPETTNPLILKPTKERAIVEYILNEKWCDEGILIEALKTYLQWFRNDEELYCVADFFGLDRKTLDYWIKEALEDAEV